MADNVPITAGSGTDVGTDDISSVHYQRVKVIQGEDGTNDGDVSRANPLPVAPLCGQLIDETGQELTIKQAVVRLSAPGSGANQLIAGVVGKKIRVLAFVIECGDSWILQDDQGTPKELTQLYNSSFSTDPLQVVPPLPLFVGETGAGHDLDINLTTGSDVEALIIYVEV